MNKTKTDKRNRYSVFFLMQRAKPMYTSWYDSVTQTRRAAFATAGVDYHKLRHLPFGVVPGADYVPKNIQWKERNYRSAIPSPFVGVKKSQIPDAPTAKSNNG